MKKLINISENERSQILEMHLKSGYKTLTENTVIKEQSSYKTDESKTKQIQQILVFLGYNLGKSGEKQNGVDGNWGNLTTNALLSFQKQNGLPQTGTADKETLIKMVTQVNKKKLENSKKNTEEKTTATTSEIQQGLVDLGYDLGNSGKNKDGVDGVMGNKTKGAITVFQAANSLPKTGKLDSKTISLILSKSKVAKTTKQKEEYNCIAVSQDTCKKVTPTKEVGIGTGDKEEGCARYARKCLGQYDQDLNLGGAAWFALPSLKSQKGSQEKYNMFANGEINWDKIRQDTVKQKITKKLCEIHKPEPGHKDKQEPKVRDFIKKYYPESSGVNLSKLQLGDFVGLYWAGSTNMGKAFCQRALKNGLNEKGEFSSKEPFSFNTHIGFVGAIKNGEPIIFHNVDGTYLATPAKQYLNKSGKAMITWVVSDPDVAMNIQKPESDEVVPGTGIKKFGSFPTKIT